MDGAVLSLSVIFCWMFLPLCLLSPGSAEHDQSKSFVVSNISSRVLLPCSPESGKEFTAAEWDWVSPLDNGGYRVCEITRDSPGCDSPNHMEISVADSDPFRTRNFSLFLTPTISQAGDYQCNVYKKKNELEYASIVHLIVFNVSASADSSLTLGGSLALTCHISPSGYSNPKPTIHTNGSITWQDIEVQWVYNGQVIFNGNRHSLDLRSLNISNLQHSDSGIYRYVFKIKGSISSFQKLDIMIPSSSMETDVSESYVVSNISSTALLPCSPKSRTIFTVAVWDWIPTSGENQEDLCTISETSPVCDFPRHKWMSLADSNAFQTGNLSLLLTPTLSQAGLYHCIVFSDVRTVYESFVHLVVFKVSVSADSSLTVGGRLALTCHISASGYSNPKPTIHRHGSITWQDIEVQWAYNGEVIINDSRHSLDLRSLNISNLQHNDSGIYRYSVKIKGLTSSFQTLDIMIPSEIVGLNHWLDLGIRTVTVVTLMIIFTFVIFTLFKRHYRKLAARADSLVGKTETQDNAANTSIPLRSSPSVASSDRDQEF